MDGQMHNRSAVRQAGALLRSLLMAISLACLLGAQPVWAQTGRPGESGHGQPGAADGRAQPSARAPDAPVISAPDDPGRSVPGAMSFVAPEAGGIASPLMSDIAPPPMEQLGASALPVVVELFTSQGCSSCPAADAMLAELSDRPDILPLSFHVDYWDYLGWADSFAKPGFTNRQEAYARASGERALFTPQLIVDGHDTAVAPGPVQLMALIDASRIAPAMVSIQRDSTADGEAIELMPLSDLGGPVDILLIRYAPRRRVEMTAGENRGRTVTYTNVVLAMERLAHWDGIRPLRMTVRPDGGQGGEAGAEFPADTRHVLIAQRQLRKSLPGMILAAIRLD